MPGQYLKKRNEVYHSIAKDLKLKPAEIQNIVNGSEPYEMEYVFGIMLRYGDLNPRWLMQGKGEMDKDEKKQEKKIVRKFSLDHKKEMQAFADTVNAIEQWQQATKKEVEALGGKLDILIRMIGGS